MLQQYTALTGRMSMPPKWAMGLWYHPQEHSNQTRVLEIVESFEKNNVPLAALTLEPPWQTHAYSCSYVWNPAMFWDPKGFIQTLATKDVQLTLWEHGYVYNGTTTVGQPSANASPLFMPLLENDCAADWITWGGLTPDFTLNKTKQLYKEYHTKTFVDIGVAGFKLDECDGNPGQTDPGSGQKVRWFFPDNASFPSGMTGAQMRKLRDTPSGFRVCLTRECCVQTTSSERATGHCSTRCLPRPGSARSSRPERCTSGRRRIRPPSIQVTRACLPLALAYCSHLLVLASDRLPSDADSYDYPNYVLGVVNSGWGGWVWAPETRHATESADFARRAQLMLFSGLASMDGWNTGFVRPRFVPAVLSPCLRMNVLLAGSVEQHGGGRGQREDVRRARAGARQAAAIPLLCLP